MLRVRLPDLTNIVERSFHSPCYPCFYVRKDANED